MTRIGMLADTHGRFRIAREAVEALLARGIDIIVHLGDVGSQEVLQALAAARRSPDPGQVAGRDREVHVVFGNTDHDASHWALEAETLGIRVSEPAGRLEVDGKVIVFQHGHRYEEMQAALRDGVDYILHGHTHRRRDERIGRTRVINPGALHRTRDPTVAILDPSRDDLEFIELERL